MIALPTAWTHTRKPQSFLIVVHQEIARLAVQPISAKYSNEGRSTGGEAPNPGRSGAITKHFSARPPITFRNMIDECLWRVLASRASLNID
jgi:hypothetical protein